MTLEGLLMPGPCPTLTGLGLRRSLVVVSAPEPDSLPRNHVSLRDSRMPISQLTSRD